MAQRNPMNERYQGDGPQGKTRKSAAKLKPKAEAASSVHIDKKPATKQERKAARKKRDAQMATKESERKRRAEEREKQALLAEGVEVKEPKKDGALDKVKKFFIADPKNAKTPPPPRLKSPDTPEYRRYKRIYWILMGIGVVAILASFMVNFTIPNVLDGMGVMVPMGIAYVTVIGAIILDYTKIKKLQKAHNLSAEGGKASPKQLKHEQQKAEAAALLEESKKAQKDLKRANSKLPFVRKPKEDTDTGTSDKTEE